MSSGMSSYPTCSSCGEDVDIGLQRLVYCRSCHREFHHQCLDGQIDRCPSCGLSLYGELDLEEETASGFQDALGEDHGEERITVGIPLTAIILYFVITVVLGLVGVVIGQPVLILVGLGLFFIPLMIFLSVRFLEQQILFVLRRSF